MTNSFYDAVSLIGANSVVKSEGKPGVLDGANSE